jgi:hypothetical protein
MNSRIVAIMALLCGLAFATSAGAATSVEVHIDIGNAPPAPHFEFHARPHEVWVPEERVYVVDDPHVGDNDCFRYEGYYWVFRDGYWYRASHWRGPFAVVHPKYVPAAIYRVPDHHWKHYAHRVPPGQAKKYDEEREEHGKGHEKHDDDHGR